MTRTVTLEYMLEIMKFKYKGYEFEVRYSNHDLFCYQNRFEIYNENCELLELKETWDDPVRAAIKYIDELTEET